MSDFIPLDDTDPADHVEPAETIVNGARSEISDLLNDTFGHENEGELGHWTYEEEKLEDRELEHAELLILSMYFKGLSLTDIARCTIHSAAFVRNTLLLPRSKEIISEVEQAYEMELSGLKGTVVKVMRDVLQQGEEKNRVAMVDKYFKAVGRFDKDPAKTESAEDVIAKMLTILEAQGSAINNLTQINTQQLIESSPITLEAKAVLIEEK